MRRPRIFVAGLWHETNTFSLVRTCYEDFVAFQYAAGEEMLRYRGTNTELGGMIAGAEEFGLDLVFALFAGAVPSGIIEAAAYRRLVEDTLANIATTGAIDGVLLAIHGALVAEGTDNAEAEWINAVRGAVGVDKPAVVTFDLHANLSARLIQAADAFIGYDTYPHVDMEERGRDAAKILARILATRRRPHRAFRKLPLLTVPQTQGTADRPARDIYGALKRARSLPGVVTASVALGFPYSDRADLGVSVIAYCDEGTGAANVVADEIAGAIWQARHDFVPRLADPAGAIAEAIRSPDTTILVDVADNVGGGAPGDGTVLLEGLLAAAPLSAAVVIWDAHAATHAASLGVGAHFSGHVGGRADRLHGAPAQVSGTVAFAGTVRYTRQSSYMTGQVVDLGQVAVVDCSGIKVMLTERRSMPFDSDHLQAAGIVPGACKALVVKSAIAWRAGFEAIAARHVFVDTPGICSSNLHRFDFRRGAAGLFPLDREATWP